jgi:hypothetical protein
MAGVFNLHFTDVSLLLTSLSPPLFLLAAAHMRRLWLNARFEAFHVPELSTYMSGKQGGGRGVCTMQASGLRKAKLHVVGLMASLSDQV